MPKVVVTGICNACGKPFEKENFILNRKKLHSLGKIAILLKIRFAKNVMKRERIKELQSIASR